jgi:16S rRNA (uracil1498-N3)-methyltransferase
MTRLFVKGRLDVGDEYSPTKEERHYLKNVLRVTTGEKVVLIDEDGGEFEAEAKITGRRELVVTISKKLPIRETAKFQIHLYVGLLKGKKMERVVRDASELGVMSLTPFVSSRAIQRDLGTKSLDRMRKIAAEEGKVSRTNRIMEISFPLDFSDALNSADGEKLIFWEEGGKDLKRYLSDKKTRPKKVSIFIGPEGGFSTEEIKSAKDSGFTVLGLGDRILRAEVAPIVVTSIIQYEWGGLKVKT